MNGFPRLRKPVFYLFQVLGKVYIVPESQTYIRLVRYDRTMTFASNGAINSLFVYFNFFTNRYQNVNICHPVSIYLPCRVNVAGAKLNYKFSDIFQRFCYTWNLKETQ